LEEERKRIQIRLATNRLSGILIRNQGQYENNGNKGRSPTCGGVEGSDTGSSIRRDYEGKTTGWRRKVDRRLPSKVKGGIRR